MQSKIEAQLENVSQVFFNYHRKNLSIHFKFTYKEAYNIPLEFTYKYIFSC